MNYLCKQIKQEFPSLVSYNRFVELQQNTLLPLGVYLRLKAMGICTEISFIDSTPLRSCHIKRKHQHRVFRGIAEKGQCSIGWFYGFKLHLIINDKGEIPDFMLTKGNMDDRSPLKHDYFHKKIFGKLFADKGYISNDLFERLFVKS